MKKFYAFALAAIVGLTAAAATRQAASEAPVLRKTATLEVTEVAGTKLTTPLKVTKHAPAKAAALTEDGQYIWARYGLLNSDGDDLKGSMIQIEVAENGTDATISGILSGVTIAATVDLEAGTLVIEKQYLTNDDDGPVYFYFKAFDEEGYTIPGEAEASCAGTFTPAGIEFPEDIIWAVGDPANESVGFYVLSYYNNFIDPAALPEEVLYGKAVFTEHIFSPLFGINDMAPYEVDVTYYEDEPDILYVNDAAKGFYALQGWGDYESPTWTLDITDRTNVMLPLSSLDFGNGSSITNYYICGRGYYDSLGEEETPDEFKITCTEDGNTVTITFPVKSTYLVAYPTYQMYYASAAESTLVITRDSSGVQNIATDANAPVEYFNLQGVKVQNPEAGLFIRRQGNTATKILVK